MSRFIDKLIFTLWVITSLPLLLCFLLTCWWFDWQDRRLYGEDYYDLQEREII